MSQKRDLELAKQKGREFIDRLEELKKCGKVYQETIIDWLENTTVAVKDKLSLNGLLNTLLIEALQKNNIEAINIIMSDTFKQLRKSILNYQNANGAVPLVIAIFESHTRDDYKQFIKLFLEAGADVNQKVNKKGIRIHHYTALHAAISIKDPELVRSILAHHPDLTIKSGQNETPLELAQRKGHPEIIKMVQKAMAAEEKEEEEFVDVDLDVGDTYTDVHKVIDDVFGEEFLKTKVLGRGHLSEGINTPTFEWTAFGPNKLKSDEVKGKVVGDIDKYIKDYKEQFEKVNFDTKNMPVGTRQKFKTFIAYVAELNALPNKKMTREVIGKVQAATHFLNEIFKSDPLTEDIINTALNNMEKRDMNRSRLSLYRVHSLITGKRFGKGEKGYGKFGKLVKSSMGELGYNLAQSLKDDLVPSDQKQHPPVGKSK